MRPSSDRDRAGARLVALAGALALATAVLGAPGCGTNAVGVEACRAIQTARCINAPNCGVDLSKPVHRGAPGSDVDACISFYHDQCLHGLVTATDPGSAATSACVAAINSGTCAVVNAPETDPACAFLSDVADAGATDTNDAATAEGGFACPSGCVDFGQITCGTAHLCACSAPISPTPAGCIASGTPLSGNASGYCCQ